MRRFGRILFWLGFQLLIAAEVFSVPPAGTADSFHQSVSYPSHTIQGTVTECWEGKLRRVSGMRVFILGKADNPEISSKLDEMKKSAIDGTTESMERFLELYDEFVVLLKDVGEHEPPLRTIRGEFAKIGLTAGKTYLVIAIDWDNDTDDAANYRAITTKPLTKRQTIVNIYMGPGTRTSCKG